MNQPLKKRILIAPLDWGLGHATRCIPVIRNLQSQGHEVILASAGRALIYLKEYFPETPRIVFQKDISALNNPVNTSFHKGHF